MADEFHEEAYVEEPVAGEEHGGYDELHQQDIAAILSAYQKRQFMLHMTGPLVSLLVHIVVLTIMAVFITGERIEGNLDIEVTIEEVPIKELEPPQITEIQEIQEDVTDEAPRVDTPDAPTEEAPTESALEDVSEEAPSTDDNMDMEEVLDVEMSNSPLKLAGYYGGRSAEGQGKMVRRFGGSGRGQDAVLKALRWLAEVQNDNGSWANNPAHSGLALLCFLAHGETPLSEEFGVTVQKGMQWLANAMNNSNGICGGRAYSHGIATYALAEAYGMTRIPFLRTAMEKGLARIVEGQMKNGGYNYRYSKGNRWDMSVAGWQFQAMKAGYVSGATTPGLSEAIEKSIDFCKNVAYKNYKFGYSSPGSGGNMTGVGTVALQLLGHGAAREVNGAINNTIMVERLNAYKKVQQDIKNFSGDGKKKGGHAGAGRYIYGWYYDTQAVFNVAHKDKRMWREWRDVFEDVLVKAQHPAGYWEANGHGMGPNTPGRILSTTWCVLQLEVYYRYLPTFDIKKMDAHRVSVADGLEDIDDDIDLIIE